MEVLFDTVATTGILISDFDGTITHSDFYMLALPLLAPGAPDYWGQYTRGRLTHFEAMRGIYSQIRCDEERIHRLMRDMEPDPRLAEGVARLRRAGWEIAIASAGCEWYIGHILRSAGVEVATYANPGRFEPERGLLLELPVNSPWLSLETGIDKVAVVRAALARYDRVAFAGDGPPDLAPALLAAPELRFASGWLAGELRRRKLPFQPFARWFEIVERLAPPRIEDPSSQGIKT